jgi:hypothetical protein
VSPLSPNRQDPFCAKVFFAAFGKIVKNVIVSFMSYNPRVYLHHGMIKLG